MSRYGSGSRVTSLTVASAIALFAAVAVGRVGAG